MRYVATLIVLLVSAVVVMADLGGGEVIINRVRGVMGDKVAHLLLAGVLTLSLNLAWPDWWVRFAGLRLRVGTLAVFVVGTLDELSNLLLARRSFSLLDLAFNYLGIALFAALAWLLIELVRCGSRREAAQT